MIVIIFTFFYSEKISNPWMNIMCFMLNTCTFQSDWLLQVQDLQAISCFICRDELIKPLGNHADIVRIHL